MSDAQDPTAATSSPVPQTTPERLQAVLDSPCVVRLRTGGKRVTASIPELGILVSAGGVEAAHAEALRQREARIREFASEGMLDELSTDGGYNISSEPQKRLLPQLKVFLIKAAVVTVLFLAGVNIISNGLGNVGYVLEKKLDGVVTWTPETVEKHRAKGAKVAENLRPVILAVMSAFKEASPTTTSTAVDNSTAKP
ncbi:MAG: hypothetical protein KKF77_16160 [Proteobacteria bacterium]|nr:hypothetical protein [Pseudomonadota bacterium]